MKYRFVVTEVPVEMGKLSLVYYIVGRRSSTTLAEDGPRMVRMTLQNYDFISRPTSTEFDAFLQLQLWRKSSSPSALKFDAVSGESKSQLYLFVDSWDTVCSSSRIKEKHNVFVRKPVYRTGKCRDVEFWRVYPQRVLKCVKLIMLIYRVEEYQQISIQRASNNNSSTRESHIDLVIRL